MGDRSVGLIEKYKVERTDGKSIQHGCIVLEWDDPLARKGIRVFSAAVRAEGYIALADDLDRLLGRWDEPLLGLATTSQLLEEIAVRGEMEPRYEEEGGDMAMGARNLLQSLPGSMLNYRTVDGDG